MVCKLSLFKDLYPAIVFATTTPTIQVFWRIWPWLSRALFAEWGDEYLNVIQLLTDWNRSSMWPSCEKYSMMAGFISGGKPNTLTMVLSDDLAKVSVSIRVCHPFQSSYFSNVADASRLEPECLTDSVHKSIDIKMSRMKSKSSWRQYLKV